MTFDAQTVIVLLVVLAAGAYLVRAAWQSIVRKRASACGGCGTCPSGGKEEPQVIGMDQLRSSAPAGPKSLRTLDR